MSNEEDGNVFTREYRHDQVVKFIKKLVNGSTKLLVIPSNLEPAAKLALSEGRLELVNNIVKYVSGDIRGEERESLERDIFKHILMMRISQIIEDDTSQHMEDYMNEIRSKIDSTNALLLELLKIFRAFGDKHD